MTGVRFRTASGFEGRCDMCREWWPIDTEFWDPKHGLSRCRACLRAFKNETARRKYASDAQWAERKRLEARAQRLAKGRGYGHERWRRIAADPEQLAAHKERSRRNVKAFRQRQREDAA